MNAGNMTLLKLADKLVREGHYAQALETILQARQEDPANRYAEAYEERVRALLPPQPTDIEPEKSRGPEGQVETPPLTGSENIVEILGKANEAVSCNDFSGALELIGQARKLKPDDSDIKALEEHVRMTCSTSAIDLTPGHEQEIIHATIRAYEDEVHALAARGEFEEAKELLARALMLDPADSDLRACEELIYAAAILDRQQTEAHTLAADMVQQAEPDPGIAITSDAPRVPGVGVTSDAPRVPGVEITQDAPRVPDVGITQDEPRVQGVGVTSDAPRVPDVGITQDEPRVQGVGIVSDAPRVPGVETTSDAPRVPGVGIAPDAPPIPGVGITQDAPRVPDVQSVKDVPPAPGIKPITDAVLGQGPDPAGKPATAQHADASAAKSPAAGPSSAATRQGEINQHLNAARVFRDSGAYDEALTEIAFGCIIDPVHEGLHALEESVWAAKASRTADDESARSSGDCNRRIRLQILVAEEFARSGEFAQALDGLAKAYVIDPANNELKRAEVRIRQQEIRHHQAAAQPLTLVYHHDRAANAE
jgi:tetratricopeptide (TPR) repeat protein